MVLSLMFSYCLYILLLSLSSLLPSFPLSFLLSFWNKISDWPGTSYKNKASLELTDIHLPLSTLSSLLISKTCATTFSTLFLLSFCIYLPSANFIGVHTHTWLLLRRGWNLGLHACETSTLLIELYPQLCSLSFYTFCFAH